MSKNIATTVYIGEPIDHDSERKFLASIVEWLVEHQIPFVVLANLHLRGRQIDCVVATAHSVSVIEVKSSYLPVRGGFNGMWAQFQASGDWRPYTNAYQQALAAKNAIRDAMNAIKPVGRFYPDRHVLFTSGFAKGSRLTSGDFKVTVTTLDRFLTNFKVQGAAPWSLDDWRAFAARHALTPVSAAEAIASPEDRAPAEVLKKIQLRHRGRIWKGCYSLVAREFGTIERFSRRGDDWRGMLRHRTFRLRQDPDGEMDRRRTREIRESDVFLRRKGFYGLVGRFHTAGSCASL